MIEKRRRAGTTVTFSVSVDRETKDALRELADREFGGNISALVMDLAEEARRRKSAGDYLRRHGIRKLTKAEADKLQAQIDAELALARRTTRKRRSVA